MNKSEVSSYFSALGKVGGRARWKNISKKERSEKMRQMANLRHKKEFPTVSQKGA